MLQQYKTEIVNDPRKYLTLIHGVAGVGKTSFGAQIPGHYFLIAEAGTEGVEVYGDPILTWQDFLNKGAELIEARETGFKEQRTITTVVIDTLEALYELAAAWICENVRFPEKGVLHKVDKIEDASYGRGYKATNKLLLQKLNALMLRGFGIVLLSHTKERTITWKGQEVPKYGPNLAPSAAQAIIDACGAVAHFDIDEITKKDEVGNIVNVEEGRWMYWQKEFNREAKHRLPDFPAKLPLQREIGYQTYVEAFTETYKAWKKKKELTASESE